MKKHAEYTKGYKDGFKDAAAESWNDNYWEPSGPSTGYEAHATLTRDNTEPEVIYEIDPGPADECTGNHADCKPGFVVSPDGVGRYWYDTHGEAVEQHGDLDIVVVEHITE